jgi:hypothetical protein
MYPNLGTFWMALEWKTLLRLPILLLFGIFNYHLVYFTAIWHSLWSFATFFSFWYVVARKIWQPWKPTSGEVKKADRH